jgi:monoterpene epsilon-lactone hydrolase
MLRSSAVALATVCCAIGVTAQTQQSTEQSSKETVDKDGIFHMPAYQLPLSIYMSEEAKALYRSMDRMMRSPPAEETFVGEAKVIYPVIIEEGKIASVRTDVVMPKDGAAKENRNRVFVNLHGGGFHCQHSFQLLEAIPIASAAKIKVISVDYRCAPEYKFPAASEDVAAVYKELLKQYKPQNIGIYGCSAGGILTAESVAWFQKEKLPRPGAIGIFCAADGVQGGDSRYMAPLLGEEVPPPVPNPPENPAKEYFAGVDVKGPLISPSLHPEVLAQFPPTLLITAMRDFLFSPVVYAHTQLVKAGVDAELHVWDGMMHCFFFSPDMPESKEMYEVTAKFFEAHLGRLR